MPDEALLTLQVAYRAMYRFLELNYDRSRSDDLGVLLGGMSLLRDGGTADPAVWAEWEVAVTEARRGAVSAELVVDETTCACRSSWVV